MNAIQALRAQALACGHLKSNDYVKVTQRTPDTARAATGGGTVAAPSPAVLDFLGQDLDQIDDDLIPTYSGPAVVPPPQRVIQIVPADPEVVYVPRYDPVVFYGAPLALYPGYAFSWPAPVYYGPAFGAWGFGVGISIRFGFGHPWGWSAWGVHWGPGFGYPRYDWHPPTVIFNNHVYISHSTTVVNHFAGTARPGFSSATGTRPSPAIGSATAAVARSASITSAARIATAAPDYAHMAVPKFAAEPSSGSAASRALARTVPGTAERSSGKSAAAATALPARAATTPPARPAEHGSAATTPQLQRSPLMARAAANKPTSTQPPNAKAMAQRPATAVQAPAHRLATPASLHAAPAAPHLATRSVPARIALASAPHGPAHVGSATAAHGAGAHEARRRAR